MKLVAPPAFTDTYLRRLHDGMRAVVADPEDISPAGRVLDAQRLQLAGILVTDHVDVIGMPEHAAGHIAYPHCPENDFR
jgi:hypothetical protein